MKYSVKYSDNKIANMFHYLNNLTLSTSHIQMIVFTLSHGADNYGYKHILNYGLYRLVWAFIKCGYQFIDTQYVDCKVSRYQIEKFSDEIVYLFSDILANKD